MNPLKPITAAIVDAQKASTDVERQMILNEYNAGRTPDMPELKLEDIKVPVEIEKDNPDLRALADANAHAEKPEPEGTTGKCMILMQDPQTGLTLPVFNRSVAQISEHVYPPRVFDNAERAAAWHMLCGLPEASYAIVRIEEHCASAPLPLDEIPTPEDLGAFMTSMGYGRYDANWRHADGYTGDIPVSAVHGKTWHDIAVVFGYTEPKKE